jgi:hypothetical protein
MPNTAGSRKPDNPVVDDDQGQAGQRPRPFRRPGVLGRDTDAAARWLLILDRWQLREERLGPWQLHASTRDAPVNLSDSRPEAHQHCLPAGANCCHSLLLDPDATMLIDLHKWLFLLVTERGE